jgi:hypothetical protein
LGDNTTIKKLKPTFVFQEDGILKDKKIIQISAGGYYNLVKLNKLNKFFFSFYLFSFYFFFFFFLFFLFFIFFIDVQL